MNAVRAIAQSGLQPANCRLLDPGEAALFGCLGHGGQSGAGARGRVGGVPVDRGWPSSSRSPATTAATVAAGAEAGDGAGRGVARPFLRMPYVRDASGPDRGDRRDVRDRLHVGPRG